MSFGIHSESADLNYKTFLTHTLFIARGQIFLEVSRNSRESLLSTRAPSFFCTAAAVLSTYLRSLER